MKKTIITLIISLMLTLVFSGCNIQNNENTENNNMNIENSNLEEEDDLNEEINQNTNNVVNNANDNNVENEELEDKDSDNNLNNNGNTQGNTIEEIIDTIYEKAGGEYAKMAKIPLSADNVEYMLGLEVDYIEGVASEPMINAIAHSLVLFTVDESADKKAIMEDIKENVNGRKWICVGVEDENILVGNEGNYIILIMDEKAEELMAAFHEILGNQ